MFYCSKCVTNKKNCICHQKIKNLILYPRFCFYDSPNRKIRFSGLCAYYLCVRVITHYTDIKIFEYHVGLYKSTRLPEYDHHVLGTFIFEMNHTEISHCYVIFSMIYTFFDGEYKSIV